MFLFTFYLAIVNPPT